MATKTLVIHVDVSRQTLRDLLCTAVEGGSNYWARFTDAERTPDGDYLQVRLIERESHATDKPAINLMVDADELRHGLSLLARVTPDGDPVFQTAFTHFGDALSGTGDATTADVVLQMTVFGEVIYG
jgi:hypothetical protein